MLELDSPKWAELPDAYNHGEKIPELLKQLALDTTPKGPDEEPWFSLWSSLYHQGRVYPASIAAVPHIIQIGHNAVAPIDPSFFSLPKEILVAQLKDGIEVSEELWAPFILSLHHLLKIKLALNEKPALEDDGSSSMTNADGLCKQCGHAGNPHMIIPLWADPKKGGIMVCPEEGCNCFRTWEFNPKQG